MPGEVHGLVPVALSALIQDRRDLSGKVLVGDRRKLSPTLIVIHRNTASHNWFREHPEDVGKISHVEALARFHAQPGPWHFRVFPYHYFIDRDGTISQVHDEMTVSPHARGINQKAIGVSLNIDGRREPPTREQLESVIRLCVDIRKRRPKAGIIGHSLKKQCPGPHVKVSEIEAEVVRREREKDER